MQATNLDLENLGLILEDHSLIRRTMENLNRRVTNRKYTIICGMSTDNRMPLVGRKALADQGATEYITKDIGIDQGVDVDIELVGRVCQENSGII